MGRRRMQRTIFVVLTGDQVNGHWHGVEFLTEDQLAKRGEAIGKSDTKTVLPLTHVELREKFWVTETWEVVSTSDVIKRFGAGVRVKGYTGPHGSEADASNCIDAAWEAPDGKA